MAAQPRASRRQESAEQTRRLILEAAQDLFITQGYAATTVNDIAARARVAVATVYTSVGGKPTLLRALIEAGVNDPETARTVAATAVAADPGEVLRLVGAGTRHGHQSRPDTIRLMRAAAGMTASAAAAARDGAAAYRQALRVGAVRLNDLRALRPGLTVEQATQVLWFYFGLHSWPQLVDEGGWSYDEAERWLVDRAGEALLRA
ncbi:TetR/AcrR family transcriptional regulator [Micromonospora acroterricola]|uniref:TetR/AcrR family transcriptional regulator n=1 Tax=Micromonospora acroterricola TaxID=2202421 RepID=A0A317CZW7_9ACTN|nr:TetR/AcrR family transcriptional regulator [Micromonospora acroterricola]PWR05845.1 TetR/AcrR family transcriptional regulator [Micromonospora acroterricola]